MMGYLKLSLWMMTECVNLVPSHWQVLVRGGAHLYWKTVFSGRKINGTGLSTGNVWQKMLQLYFQSYSSLSVLKTPYHLHPRTMLLDEMYPVVWIVHVFTGRFSNAVKSYSLTMSYLVCGKFVLPVHVFHLAEHSHPCGVGSDNSHNRLPSYIISESGGGRWFPYKNDNNARWKFEKSP